MRLASVRILLPLLALAILGPAPAMAQEFNSGYGPLPVFELHSGFWINLHHTLYYETKQRGAASSSPQKGSPAPQLKLKTMKDSGTALTPAEHRTWDSAGSLLRGEFCE
jgi:hypothetical protein